MGTKKVKVADVERATKIHRHEITGLHKEQTKRINFETLEKLCDYFECSVSDLLEKVDK